MAAGISAAIYASVFNDYMDLDQDRRAGKKTPMMDLSPAKRSAVIFISLSLMAAISLLLLHMPASLTCFLLIWAVYTAYSLPPIRLKERGILGVLCIGVGEHVLASFLAVFLVAELTGRSVPWWWLLPVLGWSLPFGCRGIVWHQLADIDNDRKVGCTTMGANLGAEALRRFGERVLFPIEVFSFLTFLILCNNLVVWLLLALHLFFEWMRYRFWSANIIIVDPVPGGRFALFEYYQLFFPLAILFSALPRDPTAAVLIGMFCLTFAAPLAVSMRVLPVIRWRLLEPWLRKTSRESG